MYRAVTWLVLRRGLDVRDESAVTLLARAASIDVKPASRPDGRACDLILDGRDITWEAHQPEVDANVSIVAAYPGVRRAMYEQQRRIGQRGRVVMVGRDIGTVIVPEADLKIYLDASPAERARRRHLEIEARGTEANENEVLAGVVERDRIDTTRDLAPLKPAPDALVINSDQLSADAVFEGVKRLYE